MAIHRIIAIQALDELSPEETRTLQRVLDNDPFGADWSRRHPDGIGLVIYHLTGAQRVVARFVSGLEPGSEVNHEGVALSMNVGPLGGLSNTRFALADALTAGR